MTAQKLSLTIRVLKDGREIISLLNKAGRDEYFRRIRVMWERQNKRCCLEGYIKNCPGKLRLADAVFEHQDGRGFNGGHRDDRIERLNRKTGKMEPYNGAAHVWCNLRKGSVRIDYHKLQTVDDQQTKAEQGLTEDQSVWKNNDEFE